MLQNHLAMLDGSDFWNSADIMRVAALNACDLVTTLEIIDSKERRRAYEYRCRASQANIIGAGICRSGRVVSSPMADSCRIREAPIRSFETSEPENVCTSNLEYLCWILLARSLRLL
jgi:hypothetical protein